MTPFVFGLFGLIIGSFLNVVILRHGVKTILGRSSCMACGHELEARDLVPVFSWIARMGRCRFCGSRISAQYPLVEALTAAMFAFVGGAPIPLLLQFLALPVVALLIVITVYDFRHTVIPDSWAYGFAFFALLFSAVFFYSAPVGSFVPILLAGPLAALPFAALWFVSKGTWMGLGDAKLALGIGFLLGPLFAYVAILAAFVAGALVSVCILLPLAALLRFAQEHGITAFSLSRAGFTMKSEVPFGPFLAASCVIVWLLLLYNFDLLTGIAGLL